MIAQTASILQPTTQASGQAVPDTHTRLRGARLWIAQIVWGIVVTLALVVFIALIPLNVRDIAGDWQVIESAPALTPYVSRQTLGHYILVLRYIAASVFFIVAGIVFWRKRDDWMAMLVSATLVLLPLTMGFAGDANSAWTYYSPWDSLLQRTDQLLRILAICCFILIAYLFPDGRFVPRKLAWIAIGTAVVYPAMWLLGYVVFVNLLGWKDWDGDIVWWVSGTLMLSSLIVALLGQAYRYRRISNTIQRQQTKWVLFGISAMILTVFVGTLLMAVVSNASWRIATLAALVSLHLGIFVPTLIPITIGISILRYRLWDIDIVIRRALAYGPLVGVIAAIYALIVGGLGALLHSAGDPILAIVATGLIAVLFNPLRTWMQRLVNRALYGERDDPVAVLSRLGQRLEAATVPEAALKSIADTLAQALKLPYAEIALKEMGEEKVVAVYDREAKIASSPSQLVRVPLVHQGEMVGEMRLAPRAPGEAFSPQDVALLKNIAHQAGATAHAARLMRDLQQSRERIVSAREEERRRIRRDLHDGFGPTLASQTLKLDAAMDLIDIDPAKARELLGQLKRQTQTTVSDVRRLVYELRPPALDEQGLAGAICNLASSINGVVVTVDAPDALPALPAAVEVAAYRIVTEALTNVMRHAQATRCEIEVKTFEISETSKVLQLVISDDGAGISDKPNFGVGLRSMRERAEELGGTLTIDSETGNGTCVVARLPLPSLQ